MTRHRFYRRAALSARQTRVQRAVEGPDGLLFAMAKSRLPEMGKKSPFSKAVVAAEPRQVFRRSSLHRICRDTRGANRFYPNYAIRAAILRRAAKSFGWQIFFPRLCAQL
jgi:hypothetical protein